MTCRNPQLTKSTFCHFCKIMLVPVICNCNSNTPYELVFWTSESMCDLLHHSDFSVLSFFHLATSCSTNEIQFETDHYIILITTTASFFLSSFTQYITMFCLLSTSYKIQYNINILPIYLLVVYNYNKFQARKFHTHYN